MYPGLSSWTAQGFINFQVSKNVFNTVPDHVRDVEICSSWLFLTQGDKMELIMRVRQKTAAVVPPYPQGCFLWFQLPTLNHNLEADDLPSDIPSEGQ